MDQQNERQQLQRTDEENPVVILADDRNQELNSCIVPLEIQAPQFELNPLMFQMLQFVGQFSGLPTEDPHLHLKYIVEISDCFKMPGFSTDALKLKLFPFSLRDKAREWLNSLPVGSVTNWHQLTEKFLMKYFSPMKNAKLRREITSFQQLDEESVYEAWERFKDMLRKCPNHGIPHCIQIETFYYGLNDHTRMFVDASASGALLSKTYKEAYEIIERIAENNYQWPTSRLPTERKVAGVLELNAISPLAAQVSSMCHILKSMNMNIGGNGQQQSVSNVNVGAEASCVYSNENHTFDNYPYNPAVVYYMKNQDRSGLNSNTYNPTWRQHHNFSWSNQGTSSGPSIPARPAFPPGLSQSMQQQRPPQVNPSNSLENMMKEFIVRTDTTFQGLLSRLRTLENQMGQLATELKSRQQGTLPTDTENSRRDEVGKY